MLLLVTSIPDKVRPDSLGQSVHPLHRPGLEPGKATTRSGEYVGVIAAQARGIGGDDVRGPDGDTTFRRPLFMLAR